LTKIFYVKVTGPKDMAGKKCVSPVKTYEISQ